MFLPPPRPRHERPSMSSHYQCLERCKIRLSKYHLSLRVTTRVSKTTLGGDQRQWGLAVNAWWFLRQWGLAVNACGESACNGLQQNRSWNLTVVQRLTCTEVFLAWSASYCNESKNVQHSRCWSKTLSQLFYYTSSVQPVKCSPDFLDIMSLNETFVCK